MRACIYMHAVAKANNNIVIIEILVGLLIGTM